MSDKITITVNGEQYAGWETVTVNRNIDALAPTFSLQMSSRWSATADPVAFKTGDACTIKINGELVITGYIFSVNETDAPNDHTITVAGRAKTGDLVDCSAILPKWQLRQKKIEDIAEELCAPFGIKVEVKDPNPLQPLDTGDKIRIFRIDQGETVYDALTRLTRSAGLLLSTSAEGNLVLARAATIPNLGAFISRGINVKSSTYSSDSNDRFSQYLLKSQIPSDDETNGPSAAQLEAIADDDGVTRYRPMLVLAETPRDKKSLQTRANWERNQRAAASEKITYRLRGWGTPGGLWEPNTLVPVTDERYGILANMLVSGAALTQTREGGTLSTVDVTGPEAYSIFEAPKRNRKL